MSSFTFIPRDAGFFSVFNFLIGTLARNIKIYPYFNQSAFLKFNGGKNQHFCYWTDSEDCWLDYFEPIKFSETDDAYRTGLYKTFPVDMGFNASEEFRVPTNTQSLFRSQSFINWRTSIHEIYSKYITFNKNILDTANNFWQQNTSTSNVIGVHYRHPSHFIESGKIYLHSYFQQIDAIL